MAPRLKLAADPIQPLGRRPGVGPEFFQPAFFFVVEQRQVRAEAAGGRRVDQLARIGGAHLEHHAQIEFANSLAVDRALQIVQRVAPDDQMDAHRGTLAQDLGELPSRTRRPRLARKRRVSEIFFLPQIAKASQIVDEQKQRRGIGPSRPTAAARLRPPVRRRMPAPRGGPRRAADAAARPASWLSVRPQVVGGPAGLENVEIAEAAASTLPPHCRWSRRRCPSGVTGPSPARCGALRRGSRVPRP